MPTRSPIVAQLSGSIIASAERIVATSTSPVLQLCRQLVAAGHPPATPMEVYRGDVLCLRIRSIGEASTLRIRGGGGFLRARDADRPEVDQ